MKTELKPQLAAMKYALLLFVLPILGCTPCRESKASYVRSHKCVLDMKFNDITNYNEEGRHTYFGWKDYRCPDGTYINIENNEEQP